MSEGRTGREAAEAHMRERLGRLRQQIAAAMGPPVAYSTDGVTFGYEARLGADLPLGGYVRIERGGGAPALLGQLITQDVESRQGPEFQVDATELLDDAAFSAARLHPRIRILTGHGRVLGVLAAGFAAGSAGTGFDDAVMARASEADVRRYLRSLAGDRALLDVGLSPFGGAARVGLDPAGFSRHTFLCGQSGSGKTFALGVVLEQLLLQTDLRLVVLDPNSDFVGLGGVLPYAAASRTRAEPLGERRHEALARRYRRAAKGVRVARARDRRRPGDALLALALSDLPVAEQARVLHLDPLADREDFQGFLRATNALAGARYGVDEIRALAAAELTDDVRALALRAESLGLGRLELWARAGEPSLAEVLDGDWRALVVDLGSLPSREERSIVAMHVLGRLWERRADRRPVLVVVDEAHNVCPADPVGTVEEEATHLAVVLAGEGRKYGLHLLLATQRPEKVPANVVSQCENLLLMRTNSRSDLEQLAGLFSHVPPSLVARASDFRLGDALAAGRITRDPQLLRIEGRISPEGGGDVPTDWVHRLAAPAG